MDSEQYDIMSQAEESHWWYLGLRDAMRKCLDQGLRRLPQNPVVLDIGCGTGGNLRFLQGLLTPSYLAGFDVSERALAFARGKCPQADVYLGDIRQPELHRPAFDLMISCDVLYVPGIDASLPGLKILSAGLKPGGLWIWNLPAYEWLRSDHDRKVHTRERYTLGRVLRLMEELDLVPMQASYRQCSAFPLVVAARLPSLLWPQRSTGTSDLRIPRPWLNRALLHMLRYENFLIARGTRFPWGTSVFVAARKRPLSTSPFG